MTVTREGRRFLLATVLVGFTAFNTGNNLVYLIFSLMMSFVILSLFILRVNLASLWLDVHVPSPVFAGDVRSAMVSVPNYKTVLPSYSVWAAPGDAVGPLYCPHVKARSAFRGDLLIRFSRRGVHRLADGRLESGFPFIMFRMTKRVGGGGAVVVYPALRDVQDLLPFPALSNSLNAQSLRGHGDDIFALRDYRYGDDWRRIHWKASAKTSTLVVTEHGSSDSNRVTLVVDNLAETKGRHGNAAGRSPLRNNGGHATGRAGSDAGHGNRAGSEVRPEGADEAAVLYEKALSLTGSVAKALLDEGRAVRVLGAGGSVPFGTGDEHLWRILDYLAVLEMEETWEERGGPENDGRLLAILKSPSSPLRSRMSGRGAFLYADSV